MKYLKVSVFFVVFFLGSVSLQASGLKLQNETSFPLKAVIYGADGSILDEIDVKAGDLYSWSESNIKDGSSLQRPSKSITPMTVHWYCQDDEIYCSSEHLSSGALVRTSQGIGKKMCKPGSVAPK